MNHISIIILIIILIGSFAGLTNFLNFYFKDLIKNNWEVLRHILSGIGAATLVPLLLNMLSSNLIKETANFDQNNYFVFAGFCFVAGLFSDRFINSIGDKILKDLEQTKNKVDKAMSSMKENEEKLDFIVSSESEIDDADLESKINLNEFNIQNKYADDDIKTQIDKIVKSFSGKYRFRTTQGIAKELDYNSTLVETILEGLQGQGVLKKLTNKNGKVLWALTQMGLFMSRKEKE